MMHLQKAQKEKKQKQKQKHMLKWGKYPYTYARVSVMRSSLLKKEDYHKLLKMSLSEIIGFLQTTEYKAAIDELAIRYQGVELMEMALAKNLVETWNKLKRISAKEVTLLIESYLARTDLWNSKTILRGHYTKTSKDAITSMLLPAGQISSEQLNVLIASESIEQFLKKLTAIIGLRYVDLAPALEEYNAKHTIAAIENFLDKEYYRRMVEFSTTIPSEGRLFKQFIEAEIEANNILGVLRLRRAGIDKKEMRSYLTGKESLLVRRLREAETLDDVAKLLSTFMPFSKKAIENFTAHNALTDIELEMGRYLLRRTALLLHQNPLTLDTILGYMFAKEIEVKNLRMLLKARQLGMESEFIEQQIII